MHMHNHQYYSKITFTSNSKITVAIYRRVVAAVECAYHPTKAPRRPLFEAPMLPVADLLVV
jgi:hypothetical protein